MATFDADAVLVVLADNVLHHGVVERGVRFDGKIICAFAVNVDVRPVVQQLIGLPKEPKHGTPMMLENDYTSLKVRNWCGVWLVGAPS